MECVGIGSYIVTIAVITHGSVINLNISPETQRILENVRLFSKAGDFVNSYSSLRQDDVVLNKVNELFQKDLSGPTLDVMNEYVTYSLPKYRAYLELDEKSPAEQQNPCRIFESLSLDKGFSSVTTPLCEQSIIERIINFLSPEFKGIFLVSIHEKVSDTNLKLIFKPEKPMNLLNIRHLQTFNRLFRDQSVLPDFENESIVLPKTRFNAEAKLINDSNEYTEEEKADMLTKLKTAFYEKISRWNLTLETRDIIESIRMSYLINIIKSITGFDTGINILDYSCNNKTSFIPKKDSTYSQYFKVADIESNVANRKWGGQWRGKNKTRKYKKKRKRQRKSKSKRK